MKVLVTGAAGFIGRHLAKALLARDHEVGLHDKRWFASTADPSWITHEVTRNAELIVHCGAQCSTARSLANPVGDFVDNALGTVHVAEAARLAGGIPIIYMSTVKTSTGHDNLMAPLGLSKLTGEVYLDLYRDLYGVPSIINQPSTVYGPGQDGTPGAGWFTWFIKANLSGQTIQVAGDGTQSRDVLYIDDMVALLVDQVEHFPAYSGRRLVEEGPFTVGGGPDNEVSVNQLLAELDHQQVEHVARVPGDLQRVVTDLRRVSSVRGWAPIVGWRDGLERTRTWLKEAVDA